MTPQQRERYAAIREMYPNRVVLTVTEVAKAFGVDVHTVKAWIERRRNPLPAIDGKKAGKKNAKYKVYITDLATWR